MEEKVLKKKITEEKEMEAGARRGARGPGKIHFAVAVEAAAAPQAAKPSGVLSKMMRRAAKQATGAFRAGPSTMRDDRRRFGVHPRPTRNPWRGVAALSLVEPV